MLTRLTGSVETRKDSEFNTRDLIEIKSTPENIKTATVGEVEGVDAEVFLRTRIIVENTADTQEYASDLVELNNCSSEDVIIDNQNLKLLFIGFAQASPNITQASVSPEVCAGNQEIFNASDQVQFASKKNTYILYSEFIFYGKSLEK